MADAERPVPWPAEVAPLRPGKGIKFAVVDQATGSRSSVWRVWTAKNGDDVYLLELRTGPTWKVSHHNEGDVWRIAMAREGAAQLGVDRVVVDHWDGHVTPQGWREGVGVLVPLAYMRRQDPALGDSVRQIPTSPSHSAIHVRLLFEEPGAPGTKLPPVFPVAALTRTNGGRVYVVATPELLGARAHEALADMRDDARRTRTTSGADDDWPRFVGVFDVEGRRLLVDLSVI